MIDLQPVYQNRPKLPEYRLPGIYKAPKPAIKEFFAIPAPEYKDKNLTKRARAKYLSLGLNMALLKCTSSPIHYQYKISANCTNLIQRKGQKLLTNYCGYRWCQVCSRIRSAKLIDKYQRALDAMQDPTFVTLTLKNLQDGNQLKQLVRRFITTLNKIFDKLRKHGIKFEGFRKLEITHSKSKGYHPHFHLLIDPKFEDQIRKEKRKKTVRTVKNFAPIENGAGFKIGTYCYETQKNEYIKTPFYIQSDPGIFEKLWVKYGGDQDHLTRLKDDYFTGKKTIGEIFGFLIIHIWMYEMKDLKADIKGQDAKKANKKTLKELFKYSVKTATKGKKGQVDVTLLDSIFVALRGTRVLNCIGYNKAETREFNRILDEEIKDDLTCQEYEQSEEYLLAPIQTYYWRKMIWNGKIYDNWWNIETGAPLIRFFPNNQDQLYLERLKLPDAPGKNFKRNTKPIECPDIT